MRAAKEVVDAMTFETASNDKRIVTYDIDVPISVFRYDNPKRELKCSLCGKVGSSRREGAILAFKRGSREIL